MHHRYSPKLKKEVLARRMAVMEDNIKWEKFPPWAATAVAGTGAAPEKLTFSYVAHSGKQARPIVRDAAR